MAGGLIGVLLVVRPGGQVFGWALVFPVGLVTSYAWFQVLTSRLSGEKPLTPPTSTSVWCVPVVLSPVVWVTRCCRWWRFPGRRVCPRQFTKTREQIDKIQWLGQGIGWEAA